MAFEVTYEAFRARATEQWGEDEAQRICPDYARHFALGCLIEAHTAEPARAAALRRLAEQMNPDRRREVPGAAA